MDIHAPEWNLESLYDGFGCESYNADIALLQRRTDELVDLAISLGNAADFATHVTHFIDRWNEISDLYEQLEAYTYARFSVATGDADTSRELNRLEALGLPLRNGLTLFREALGKLSPQEQATILESELLADKAFFLAEQIEFARHQMSPEMENLAADLSRSGADAWSRLQETVASTLTSVWDTETGETKTVNELRALAFSPDRAARAKAYKCEIEAWKSVEVPLAFSLNGIKGSAGVLAERRGHDDSLSFALLLSRISRPTIEALTGAMKASLPQFRDYFARKAKVLGVPRLRFYDLFAPVGTSSRIWTFEDAKAFIIDHFTAFSERLGGLARTAFDRGWIDARTRSGKVGGAYCIGFPSAKESRVLCNFDGSFSSVLTVAHELGHAYHHEVLKNSRHIDRDYPMTLAETASIFCELIVLNAALASSSKEERILIAEQFLQDAAQLIVDILSRFLFETELFKKRSEAELDSEELCRLMKEAQLATYGEGLDPDHLHPYMWAVKSHYYSQSLPFYNFPYAFGLLFGSALYRKYKESGDAFVSVYDELLAKTGSMSANTLTAEAGFDIETEAFWKEGIDQALSFLKELPEPEPR